MMYEWVEKAKQLDFDRLDVLVSERIATLKLLVQSLDKADGDMAMWDAVCHDLIFPNIGRLAEFIENVNVDAPQCNEE